jgi:hypothetical protein
VLIVTGFALKGQPECVDVQLAAARRIGRDDRHGGEELDVHQTSSVRVCVAGHRSGLGGSGD